MHHQFFSESLKLVGYCSHKILDGSQLLAYASDKFFHVWLKLWRIQSQMLKRHTGNTNNYNCRYLYLNLNVFNS